MLLTKVVTVKWTGSNKKRLIDRGYVFTKHLDEIEISIEDLSEGSHVKIQFKCDYCEQIFDKVYKDYIAQRRTIEKDSCLKCKKLKQKEVMLERHGAESPFHQPEIQQKIKDNNLEKYGVEYYSQTDEYTEKSRKTCLDKYGVTTYSQTDECLEKIKSTNIERYGVECVFQNEDIQQKIKDTNIQKYGVENPLQNKDIQEKMRLTNLERRGVDWVGQCPEVQEKMKNTNLERYGYEHTFQVPEIQEQIRKTLAENGTVPTSQQQLDLYNLLRDSGYEVELNYPVGRTSLDVALFISELKIDIEYDGWYWHKNKQTEDRRRDEHIKSENWKVLRIKSYRQVPVLEQIEKALDKLIKDNYSYTEIVMPDICERGDAI